MNIAEIIADGVVDSTEAADIFKAVIGDDGYVDRDEANDLFAINDGVSGGDNAPSWDVNFALMIANHMLCDTDSPGEIDADEAAWFISKVEGDGTVDGAEMAVCRMIATMATDIDSSLQAKFDEWGV